MCASDCGLWPRPSSPIDAKPRLWVLGLLGFSSELFLRAFVAICDRLDLTLVPGHDLLGRGHTEDNDECVFYVQRAIWWRSNGIYLSPTIFYNRIGAPRRARSS